MTGGANWISVSVKYQQFTGIKSNSNYGAHRRRIGKINLWMH